MKMRILNVGSGITPNPGVEPGIEAEFVRLDIDPEVKPDVVHDILKPLPKKLVGKFDMVFISHVLEHISWRAVLPTLGNLAKAAKKEGRLFIVVPDMAWACNEILRGNYGMGVLGVFYGGQDNPYQFHNCGFTKEAILTSLRRLGWKATSQKITNFDAYIEGQKYICKQIETQACRDYSEVRDGTMCRDYSARDYLH